MLHKLVGSELYVDCEVVKDDDCFAKLAFPMMWIICSEITDEWKKFFIIAFAVFDFKRSFFLAGASRDHFFFF